MSSERCAARSVRRDGRRFGSQISSSGSGSKSLTELERAGSGCSRRFIPGGLPVVPRSWRDTPDHSRPAVGSVPVLLEREKIAVLKAEGRGVRAIARTLGRHPSTISRELHGTQPPWRTRPAIGPRQPSGMPIDEPNGRGWPSSLRTMCCEPMPRPPVRTDNAPQGTEVSGPTVRFTAAGTDLAKTADGPSRGAPSRSRTGSGSISPMMGPCGSAMRRSTSPSTSKAAVHGHGQWRGADDVE